MDINEQDQEEGQEQNTEIISSNDSDDDNINEGEDINNNPMWNSDDPEGDDEYDGDAVGDVPAGLLRIARLELRGQRKTYIQKTWGYNWQTKKRDVPEELNIASKAIQNIKIAFRHLELFKKLMLCVPRPMKNTSLQRVESIVKSALTLEKDMTDGAQASFLAIKYFWFPENIEQIYFGAYSYIKQEKPLEVYVPQFILDNHICVVCQEQMIATTSAISKLCCPRHPVVLKRMCCSNPFLKVKCEGPSCQCKYPSICLSCVLSHILTNSINAGKSTVLCPTCKSEFCIYDIMECICLPYPSIVAANATNATTNEVDNSISSGNDALVQLLLRERDMLKDELAKLKEQTKQNLIN